MAASICECFGHRKHGFCRFLRHLLWPVSLYPPKTGSSLTNSSFYGILSIRRKSYNFSQPTVSRRGKTRIIPISRAVCPFACATASSVPPCPVMSARRGRLLPIRPSFLVPAGLPSRTYCHGHACLARAIGAFPVSGIRLSFLIHASIRSPRQTSLARPARGNPDRPSSLVPAGLPSRAYSHGHARPARAIGAFPVSGIRLSFLIHASIRSPRQTSLARPARGIVPEPSIFPCAGRIAFPLVLPWSCPPGEGCVHYTRSLPRIVRLWQPSMNAHASVGLALPVMPCVHYTISAEK